MPAFDSFNEYRRKFIKDFASWRNKLKQEPSFLPIVEAPERFRLYA
jgi:hypothetical protein